MITYILCFSRVSCWYYFITLYITQYNCEVAAHCKVVIAAFWNEWSIMLYYYKFPGNYVANIFGYLAFLLQQVVNYSGTRTPRDAHSFIRWSVCVRADISMRIILSWVQQITLYRDTEILRYHLYINKHTYLYIACKIYYCASETWESVHKISVA